METTESRILEKRKRKIILIDDEAHKGWNVVFEYLFKKVFSDLVSFVWLRKPPGTTMDEFYEGALRLLVENEGAYFLIDNDFGDMKGAGMHLLRKFGNTRAICIHSGCYDLGFDAHKLGAKLCIRKDDPMNPKGNDAIQDDVHNLIVSICKHFGLAPELAWLLFIK